MPQLFEQGGAMQLSDGGLHGALPGDLRFLVMALFLVPAAVGDFRRQRISNRLVLGGIVVAVVFHLAFPNDLGLWPALSGMLVGFGMLLPFYILRGMAAGDVKLMAMVGAFLGPLATFWAVVVTFLVGGLWAVLIVSRRGLWSKVFSNFRQRQVSVRSEDLAAGIEAGASRPASVGRLPYGVAIAAGSLMVALVPRISGILGAAT